MSMTFPTFMARGPNNSDPTHHCKRVQEMPMWYSFPEHYFIETDDDIDSLIARAQATLVEASFVDRTPGCSSPLIEIDNAATEALERLNDKGYRAARKWTHDAIVSGWYGG